MANSLKNRILILTAGFGDGHNAAAFNLKKAFEALPCVEVRVVDIFQVAHPGVDRLLMEAYRFNITHLPGIWRQLYRLSDRISFKNDSLGLFKKATLRLKDIFETWEPTAVVHTYPFYSQLLEKIVGRFAPLPFGVFTVITDAVTINATWLRGRTDWFIVSGEDSAASLVKHGVEETRIQALGFPVDPVFAEPQSGEIGRQNYEPPARLLYLPSTPRRHVNATIAALVEQTSTPVELTVVAGRHFGRLRRTLAWWERRVEPGRIRVLGWTDRIPEFLRTHHMVIGKAGGAFVQEALAASRPMLINYVVPGQEEGNARLMVSAGAAQRIQQPSEIPGAVDAIFADGGRRWTEMANAAADHAIPDAAIRIARFVLQESVRSTK